MARRLLFLCGWALAGAVLAWGAASGSIQGRVLDASGQAVPGAAVTVTSASGAVVHASSDAQGEFVVEGLAAGAYQLSVSQHGFAAFKRKVAVAEGQPVQVEAQLQLASVVQTVMVRAGAVKGATVMPSATQVFQSSQSLRVLDREQINALSPVAGSAQIISIAPGANVTGYGNTGATKNTITLNGIQQGWGGYGGFTTAGALGVTFDRIPVSDAVTGLWQSNMFPQSAMINDTSVTYGPGDPAERGYNNIGGGVEFTPLQPSEKMHFSLAQTLGSYGQKNTAFEFTTGQYDGWSAVLSAGHGSGNSFRVASDGFASPNYDNAFYGKLIKSFNAGDLGFGGYYSLSSGYRPQVLPATNVGGVTLDGTPAGALYSQQSSGFYSTLTYADYNKYDSNRMVLLWSKLDLDLDPTTVFYNSAWFERINRLHNRLNDVYALGPQEQEWNNPFTKTFGDKMSLQKVLPYNTLTFGGSMLRSTYNSRNNFHSLALGGNDNTVNIGAKIRSSYWDQEMANVFLQDVIRPTSWLSFTPGIRYLHENLGYSNGVLNDFNFAPGVVIPTHCLLNGVFTSTPGNI
ncbi:MAG TPA: carboxypeptidase regulatory-like domain-containing protein, partial [Terriglobales bacterium]|nr:carboxypeptidase regulatory-like domain-containing protein [Terriglobales bacterium]